MSTTTIDLHEWLSCLTDVATDFAANHLRFESGAAPETPAASGGPSPAVYVAILGERNSMHLGLSTGAAGCQTLARAFLGLRGRDALSDREVVDGMSEILNILAGKVKSRMSTRDGSLKLGLPMFVAGTVGHGDGTEKSSADVMLGPVACRLHVFRQNRSA